MGDVKVFYNARLLDESMDEEGIVLCIQGKIHSVFQGRFLNLQTVQDLCASVLKESGFNTNNTDVDFIDLKGFVLTPAFIDMHVHLRDPGLTQKEDLNSGLHACAAGGFGTVVAMPNTSPVISSAKQAEQVMERAEIIGQTRLFQSVSITKDFGGKDISHIEELENFSIPVISEDGHDVESSAVMLQAMVKAAEKNIIVACHAEDCTLALMAKPYRAKALEIMKEYNLPAWGGTFASMEKVPQNVIQEIDLQLSKANEILALAENLATERNIRIAKQAGCHIHLCHVSTECALEYIRKAKSEVCNEKSFCVTCEVTPHHIALTGFQEPNIRALVNPPLRSEEDRVSVIEAIKDGTVDVLSTDHAPHTIEDKANGAPGFTGIEAAFAVYNTVLVHGKEISSKKLSSLMSANPAKILHLKKGLLKPGFDADFAIVDLNEKWTVHASAFFSKGKATPFEGKEFFGKVKATYIGGKKVF